MNKPETDDLKDFLLTLYRALIMIIRWIERKYNIVPYEERVLDQMLRNRAALKKD